MNTPKNHKDALIQGLVLAITAPSDEHASVAADLADQIASHLTSEEVEECKKAALELALDANQS
tara:strand:- start:492 stop:683 length:192 start_codon:yes stop_codon:yes gene_type:complete